MGRTLLGSLVLVPLLSACLVGDAEQPLEQTSGDATSPFEEPTALPDPDPGASAPLEDDAAAPDAGPVCPAPPAEGQECVPFQQRWCDGDEGWGLVACTAEGRWATVERDGQQHLDCRDAAAAGRRPDTECACRYAFFAESCCECEGCVLPVGGTGRVCPASTGALCEPCDPSGDDCREPGAICAVAPDMEAFCTKPCASEPCPTGFTCMQVSNGGNAERHCIPSDFSCYADIVRNVASGKSCGEICSQRGQRCVAVGSGSKGQNGKLWTVDNGSCVKQAAERGCDELMQLGSQGVECFDHLADWTYCRCL